MHRLREWDTVVTVDVPGLIGDTAQVVVLADGTVVVEEGEPGPASARALAAVRIPPPCRVRLVRRDGDLWAVAARTIEVVEIQPDPGGTELEVEWDGEERSVRLDGVPRLVPLPELGPVRRGRPVPYVGAFHRLHGTTWEAEIAQL